MKFPVLLFFSSVFLLALFFLLLFYPSPSPPSASGSFFSPVSPSSFPKSTDDSVPAPARELFDHLLNSAAPEISDQTLPVLLTEITKPLAEIFNPVPVPDSGITGQTSLPVLPPASSSAPAAVSASAVFAAVWPDYYLAFLTEVKNIMIDRGFLTAAAVYPLNTESGIYLFLNDFADFYRSVASLSAAEYDELKKKIALLPEIKARQKQEYLDSENSSPSRLFNWLVQKTYAAWQGTAPDCYKDLAPGDISTGFSSPVYCCNCGFYCNSDGCTYYSNCGANASRCNVHLGCLNGVCRSRPNGLWDSATTLCGCG